MRRSALAVLLLLAAPSPVLAAHSLTVPPNGITGCAVVIASGGVDQEMAVPMTTPVGDALDVTLGAAASGGASFPGLYEGAFSYACTLAGTGTLGYGFASGALELTTASTPDSLPPAPANMGNPPFSNSGRSNGEALLQMQFDDSGIVTSNTLAPGTAVVLEFPVALDSAAILLGRPPGNLLRASATYQVRAADVTTLASAERLLLDNEIATLVVPTAIGHTIEIRGVLSLGVYALSGREQAGGEYFAQADASIDASHTATFEVDAPEGVGFDAESGHEYAVPEPGQALAVVSGALTLIAVRRRRRSRNTAAGAAHVLQGIAAGS
jgi:hypothetical protein